MENANLTASEPLTAIICMAIILVVAMLTAIVFLLMTFGKVMREEDDGAEIEDLSEYDVTPYPETNEDNVIF